MKNNNREIFNLSKMAENFVDTVMSLYKEKNWRAIVSRFHDHPKRNKLLWVYPAEGNFQFLQENLSKLGCDRILSVGCGSGLLEWMITEATGIPVTGVEVDGAWWQCKYAPPTFIPLIIQTMASMSCEIIKVLKEAQSTALLFCYFNNGPAFGEYVRLYAGPVVIIIGPGHGKGVHTDPAPFQDLGDEWILFASQEIRDSKDFIALHCKKKLLKLKTTK